MPMTVSCSLEAFLRHNRRARKACQMRAIRSWKRYHDIDAERELAAKVRFTLKYCVTRHDALSNARHELSQLRNRMSYDRYIHPDEVRQIAFGRWDNSAFHENDRETRLRRRETLRMLEFVGRIREAAVSSLAPAPTGLAFYVSVHNGKQYRMLYGPVATQAKALRMLLQVRTVLNETRPNDRELHWLNYGTMSIPLESAVPGLLNAHFPDSDFLQAA